MTRCFLSWCECSRTFETSREKLIQIILSGQPQLAEKIASPELVQLRQRISMFAYLDPFSSEATELYINHRLRAAGYDSGSPLFTREALALIFHYSEGIPRNINNLCFNSLSLGCALKRKAIDGDVVREVVADLDLDRWRTKTALAVRPEVGALQEAPVFLSAASEPLSDVWLGSKTCCRPCGRTRDWGGDLRQPWVVSPEIFRSHESWDRAVSRYRRDLHPTKAPTIDPCGDRGSGG